MFGKQHRVQFADNVMKSKGVLVHSDVWGPAPYPSRGGALYFVTFVDDHSRKVWLYLMRHKSQGEWKAQVPKLTGRKVRCLRSDNGGEYTSNEFQNLCVNEGIRRQYSVPQQNGVAERVNRTLLEKCRSIRLQAGLGRQHWSDALVYACYLVNRSPHRSLNGGLPEEFWTRRSVSLKVLFPAYMLIEDEQQAGCQV